MEPNILDIIAREPESIADFIPVGILVLEENGKIVFVNRKAKELYGMDPSSLEIDEHSTKQVNLLTLDGKIYPPEQLPASQAFLTGKETKDELIIERSDGSCIVVDFSAKPVFNSKGQIIAVVNIFNDITDRKKSQEALKESGEQFRCAVAEAPIPMIMHAEDGPVLQLSKSWTELTGYTIKDLPVFDSWITKAVYGEGASSIRDYMHLLFKGKVPKLNIEFPILTSNQEIRYWSFSASSPGTLSDGRRFIVGMAVDITKNKKNEDKLANLSKFPLENPNPVLRLNKDGVILFSNPAGMVLLTEWKKKIKDKAPREIISRIKEAFSKNKISNFEYTCVNKTFIFSIAPILGKEYANIYCTDITLRKKIFEKLLETKHDLDHAQNVAKIGSWRLDVQRNVLSWSDESYRIFGIPKGTPLTYQTFLECIHPDDRDYVDEKWKAALLGKPYVIEHRIIVDGKVKWVYEKAELEFDEVGKVKGGFGTAQDITEFVEMREKLRQYRIHLEELVEDKTKKLKDSERMVAIGETAGMIGHDIRNPLQSMDGALYLAQEYVDSLPEGSEEKRGLKEINEILGKQIEYIDHVVADLQDFAKKAKPEFIEVDLPEIITNSICMVEIPENIIINVVFPEESLKIVADPDDLKRIFSNLVRNAVEAMPEGGEIAILTYRKEGNALIRIEDAGEGIAEEVKPNIFTPLFTTKSKGQGFGLAVCKKLIETHDGEISFQSEEGKGTIFTIKLPIKNGAV